jgi:prepilin-type N-terminal cleavage/methylation domain-containing protein
MIGVKKPGFSVVELLVVMVLFAVSITILTQTYLSFIRLSHRTANSATIQQDMRFTLEYMARNIRNMPIDYPIPPGALETVTSTLSLKSENQPAWIIKKTNPGDARCSDDADVSCLVVSSDGGTSWAPITAKHVNVETFKIYVRPQRSPFVLVGGSYDNDQQPFVTVQVKLTYKTPIEKEKVSLETQTTISSRVYVR